MAFNGPHNQPSRWTDIPELRVECAEMLERNLSSGQVADELNLKYGRRMRELGYSRLTRNMVMGEKHRERIKERRLTGEPAKPLQPSQPSEPVKRGPRWPWMTNPIFDTIRIPSRNKTVDDGAGEESEAW